MDKNTKLSLEELIRGIRTPNATHISKNSEVEGEEYGKSLDGKVHKFKGAKHEDGGMPMKLEDGEKILSDKGRPDKDYRKMLEEKYKVKINSKDTYASILDKINSKIGFKKIEDDQLNLANKLEKNEDVKDETTKNINEQVIQEKLSFLEKIKEYKNSKKEDAFDELYAIQETQKIENGDYVDEETGVEVRFEDGGIMYKKSQMPILVKLKLANGYRTEDDLKNHFFSKMSSGGMKKKNYYATGGQYGMAAIDAYLKSKEDRPNYNYGDLPATFDRFKPLADVRKINYSDINPKDLASLGKLAGRIQKYDFENTPELATDYGLDVPLTKSGIDLFLTIPDLTKDLKSKNPELYNKLTATKRGMLENKFTEDENKLISNIVREKSPIEFQTKFAKANYNDNKAYFRGIDKKEIEFNDENEYNKYLQENAKNKIGDYYKTSKSGIYIKPVFKKADIVSTPAKKNEPAATQAENVTTPAPQEEIAPPQRLPNPRWGMRMQGTPPPSTLRLPMLINPQVRDQTFVKVSPEEAIRENQRSLNFIGEQLRDVEGGTQGSAFSNIAGKLFEANNQSVNQANIWNATQRANYDNKMSRRLDSYDALRSNNLANYVMLSQTAEANTFNDWRTYFQDRENIERQAARDASLMNMYEAVTPNQNLNPRTGKIYYTKPTLGNWFNK